MKLQVFHELKSILFDRIGRLFSSSGNGVVTIRHQCGYNIMPGNRLQEINLN
ncbi:hypothetical protein [uncultured Chitinophaga sp.]|uniref:hypothetical protein n=1 Tax=uncultured Chitinophaga sp. TaxID=339340 RepID=UPI0025EDFF85|nr:hypothetical protein [uncultured Chitinophaga sp.]